MEYQDIVNNGGCEMNFICSQCRTRNITLHQWRDNDTVGICHNCGYTKELTTEEVRMIINRRVCDRPGCKAEIPEGSGYVMDISVTTLSGEELGGVKWELCEECHIFFDDLMTSEARLVKLFTSRKMSITREEQVDATEPE